MFPKLERLSMPGSANQPCQSHRDSPTQRTLNGRGESDDPLGMTIEECTSSCTALGFQLAGVEIGQVSVSRVLSSSLRD